MHRGYRRLSSLPPPPWPLTTLLDEAIVPAYFGYGVERLRNFVQVLPAIGDVILETVSDMHTGMRTHMHTGMRMHMHTGD